MQVRRDRDAAWHAVRGEATEKPSHHVPKQPLEAESTAASKASVAAGWGKGQGKAGGLGIGMKPERRKQVAIKMKGGNHVYDSWQDQLNSAAKILDEMGNLKSSNISQEMMEFEAREGAIGSLPPFKCWLCV
eukprot:5413241-Pyramimonas_sp.AAC.1